MAAGLSVMGGFCSRALLFSAKSEERRKERRAEAVLHSHVFVVLSVEPLLNLTLMCATNT